VGEVVPCTLFHRLPSWAHIATFPLAGARLARSFDLIAPRGDQRVEVPAVVTDAAYSARTPRPRSTGRGRGTCEPRIVAVAGELNLKLHLLFGHGLLAYRARGTNARSSPGAIRGEAGKLYCASCLVDRLRRRGAGAFPLSAVQATVAEAFGQWRSFLTESELGGQSEVMILASVWRVLHPRSSLPGASRSQQHGRPECLSFNRSDVEE